MSGVYDKAEDKAELTTPIWCQLPIGMNDEYQP